MEYFKMLLLTATSAPGGLQMNCCIGNAGVVGA